VAAQQNEQQQQHSQDGHDQLHGSTEVRLHIPSSAHHRLSPAVHSERYSGGNLQAAAQQAAGALLAKAEVALPVGATEEQKLLRALVMALEEHLVSSACNGRDLCI
jgi:hypothetical protein